MLLSCGVAAGFSPGQPLYLALFMAGWMSDTAESCSQLEITAKIYFAVTSHMKETPGQYAHQ